MKIHQASQLHSLDSDFPRGEEPEKKAILAFMKGVKPKYHTGAKVVDLVTGMETSVPLNASERGRWGWDATELYHFERYDLALEPAFVEFALSQADPSGKNDRKSKRGKQRGRER